MTGISQPQGVLKYAGSGKVSDATFSADGTKLYTSQGGTIAAYDVATGAGAGSWTVGNRLGAIDVSNDGRYVVAVERAYGPTVTSGSTSITDFYVYRLDLLTGSVSTYTSHLSGSNSYYYDVSFLPDGRALLTQNYPGSGFTPLTTLDFNTGAFTASVQGYAQDGVLTTSGDHSRILLAPQNISNAPLFVYSAGSGITASNEGYALGTSGFNYGVQAISSSGNLIARAIGPVGIYDSSLHLIQSLADRYPFWNGTIAGLAFNPTASSLYLLDNASHEIFELNTTNWDIIRAIPSNVLLPAFGASTGGSFGNALQINADGTQISVITSSGVQLIDLTRASTDTPTDGNDLLVGGTLGGALYGLAGDDQLVSGGSAAGDWMYGGEGNDTYYVKSPGDQVIETGTGHDVVYSSLSINVPAGVEELYFTGSSAVTSAGTYMDDLIVGNDANSTIYGQGGNDTLIGNGGRDVLYGDDGNDRLDGGAGADILIGGAGTDTLSGGDGSDIFRDSRVNLSGDIITDFEVGDRINVVDASYASFNYVRNGETLAIGLGTTLTVSSANSRFVLAGSASGGTDLIAANRYTGLNDFDGNGHSDLLFRNDNGSFSTWQVGGNQAGNQFVVNSTFVSGVGTDWQIAETFDFNGDGHSDILWRNQSTGQFSVWSGGNSSWTANTYFDSSVGSDWKIAGVGDLNGDGKDDIVWRNDGGAFSTWQSTGTGFTANVTFDASVSVDWKIVGLGDFNGDGKDDLLWRNASSGAFSEWTSNGVGFKRDAYINGGVGTDWHIDAIADFNGDGKDDLLWRHDGADSTFTTWQSTGDGFAVNAYVNGSVGSDWQVQSATDFNDDGKADILWRNTQTGEFSTWQSNGAGFDPNVAFVSGVENQWHFQAHDYAFG